MKEYIEREAVEKMLEDSQLISDGEYCGYCTEDVNLSKIPTADVIPVVRCMECKHVTLGMYFCGNLIPGCKLFKVCVDPNGFCYRGERQTNSENNCECWEGRNEDEV